MKEEGNNHKEGRRRERGEGDCTIGRKFCFSGHDKNNMPLGLF